MKHSSIATTLASTLFAAAGFCLPAVSLADDAPVKKVLIIGIDGLRPDALRQADAPNIHALAEQGAYSWDAQCESRTFSGPNWTTIMDGIHIDKHGVASNNYRDSKVADWPDFFTYLEQYNSQWVTARLITWDSFYNNQPTGADINLFHDYRKNGDQIMADQAVRLLSNADPDIKQDPDVLFIYQADVDVAGHNARHLGFSPDSPSYMKAIANADKRVGQLMEALQKRPNYKDEQWLIVVTSDHGGAMDQQHSGNTAERRNIPFIVSGPAAAKGPIFPNARNVDVAKTVLTYMGVPIQPEWQLDGHAVGLKPTAPPVAVYDENLIFNGDAEYDRGFAQTYGGWCDQYCSGWQDDGPAMINVSTYAIDTQKYPDHLSPADSETIGGGSNFFSGGYAALSRITQTIDLSPLYDDINIKKVNYALSADLGGWKDQNDCAMVIARFSDVSGHVIQTVTVGPVTAGDRHNRTMMLSRQADGPVMPGAKSVTVELVCVRLQGEANDSYADNLSLVLTRQAAED